MNPGHERFHAARRIFSPDDFATYVEKLWKSFQDSEQYEALRFFLVQLKQSQTAVLLSPTSHEPARAHAAGAVQALVTILLHLQAPESADGVDLEPIGTFSTPEAPPADEEEFNFSEDEFDAPKRTDSRQPDQAA